MLQSLSSGRTLIANDGRDFSAQITPFASRTFQFTKEQLGQAEDRVSDWRCEAICKLKCTTNLLMLQTQLPADYIDLEKKVDALKQAHQRMLAVTSVTRLG